MKIEILNLREEQITYYVEKDGKFNDFFREISWVDDNTIVRKTLRFFLQLDGELGTELTEPKYYHLNQKKKVEKE